MQPFGPLVRPRYMTTIPIDADGAIRRQTLTKRGISTNVLYRALAEGELYRIGNGLYVPAGTDYDARHRLMIAGVSSEVVVSHESAAFLHGLPMLRPDLRHVHVTAPTKPRRMKEEFQRVHLRRLPPTQIITMQGKRVTMLERTVVDVAASSAMGFAGALAIFDAALRRGADPQVLVWMVRQYANNPMVRSALRHASPCADGVGESWCRAQVIAAGLPRPRLKQPILGLRDEVIAEPDLDWSGLVVAEFDGAARYERLRVQGDSVMSAIWRAIERDEQLSRRGVEVLRFTWANLERGDVVPACRQWLSRYGLLL